MVESKLGGGSPAICDQGMEESNRAAGTGERLMWGRGCRQHRQDVKIKDLLYSPLSANLCHLDSVETRRTWAQGHVGYAAFEMRLVLVSRADASRSHPFELFCGGKIIDIGQCRSSVRGGPYPMTNCVYVG